MIGLVLTGLVALGWIGIGVGALTAPHIASRQYGILLDDVRSLALIRAMGVRDLVIGVLARPNARLVHGGGALAPLVAALVIATGR